MNQSELLKKWRAIVQKMSTVILETIQTAPQSPVVLFIQPGEGRAAALLDRARNCPSANVVAADNDQTPVLVFLDLALMMELADQGLVDSIRAAIPQDGRAIWRAICCEGDFFVMFMINSPGDLAIGFQLN